MICVFHNGQEKVFTEWSEPEKECDLGFISVVVEVACKNQWTAKSIVERAIYVKRDIYLINALLNKNCPVLKPHGKALSDRYKELDQ